jgi:hypothetical protein
MNTRAIIGTVVGGLIFLAVFFFVIKDSWAQTPTPRPDVPLIQTGGIYPMSCVAPSDLDMASICFVRTDVDPILELGCEPCGPGETVGLDLNVVTTTDDDAEIRCYAVDTSGLVGDYSLNSGTVDFTRPGRPHVIQ